MSPSDVDYALQALMSKIKERELESQRALSEHDLTNRLLKRQVLELQGKLKERENQLLDANETINALRSVTQVITGLQEEIRELRTQLLASQAQQHLQPIAGHTLSPAGVSNPIRTQTINETSHHAPLLASQAGHAYSDSIQNPAQEHTLLKIIKDCGRTAEVAVPNVKVEKEELEMGRGKTSLVEEQQGLAEIEDPDQDQDQNQSEAMKTEQDRDWDGCFEYSYTRAQDSGEMASNENLYAYHNQELASMEAVPSSSSHSAESSAGVLGANRTRKRQWVQAPLDSQLASMMYHIVVFDDTNEVEVVPSVWVSGGTCMWPPSRSDVAKAVKAREFPGDEWTSHKARVIFTSNDYNEAHLKMLETVHHTDHGSEGDSPIFNRKKIPKDIQFPGGEEDNDDGNEAEEDVEVPRSKRSKSFPCAPLSPANMRPVHSPGLHYSSPDMHTELYETPRQNSETRARPRDTAEKSRQREKHTARETHSQADADTNRGMPTTQAQQTHGLPMSLLQNVLADQEVMMSQIQILLKTMQSMNRSEEVEVGLANNTLPLKDVDSLKCLEEQLQGNLDLHKQLVSTLTLKGGVSVRECVWRFMQSLLTNSLARQINMRGINGKIGFKTLHLRKVVIAAVRRNRLTSRATDHEIDEVIKKWLHLASDRDGGRMDRLRRRQMDSLNSAGSQIESDAIPSTSFIEQLLH